MSDRLRGQNVTIRVAVDGDVQDGSWAKVKSFTASPRSDITEESYIGEVFDDLQFQHHGHDIAFEVDQQDANCIDFLTRIIQQEEDEGAHPVIVITAYYRYLDGSAAKTEVYQDVFLRMTETSVGGRKEYVSASFEGKCKRRQVF